MIRERISMAVCTFLGVYFGVEHFQKTGHLDFSASVMTVVGLGYFVAYSYEKRKARRAAQVQESCGRPSA